LDSEYDYDPFWAKAVELGVPITTHYGSQDWTGIPNTKVIVFTLSTAAERYQE
jgi:predicted TIM-barrel fold metal-dependent hydrolase